MYDIDTYDVPADKKEEEEACTADLIGFDQLFRGHTSDSAPSGQWSSESPQGYSQICFAVPTPSHPGPSQAGWPGPATLLPPPAWRPPTCPSALAGGPSTWPARLCLHPLVLELAFPHPGDHLVVVVGSSLRVFPYLLTADLEPPPFCSAMFWNKWMASLAYPQCKTTTHCEHWNFV